MPILRFKLNFFPAEQAGKLPDSANRIVINFNIRADFETDAVKQKIPLQRGERSRLKIIVDRWPGIVKPVRVSPHGILYRYACLNGDKLFFCCCFICIQNRYRHKQDKKKSSHSGII